MLKEYIFQPSLEIERNQHLSSILLTCSAVNFRFREANLYFDNLSELSPTDFPFLIKSQNKNFTIHEQEERVSIGEFPFKSKSETLIISYRIPIKTTMISSQKYFIWSSFDFKKQSQPLYGMLL
jgi:hypothetical protein